MSLPAAITALCAGIVVWWLLVRQLTAKSWQPDAADSPGAAYAMQQPPARIGLWVFLGVVTSLFGLFIAAYYIRMGHGHGAQATQAINDWHAVRDPPILWLNTVLLIAGSVALQAARQAIAFQQAQRARQRLLVGGLLTILFLAGQLAAWRQLNMSGYVLGTNPAVAFFYVLTAIHGLHLLGGLFVWARTAVRMWTDGVELINVSLSVELCSLYWHYLLLVWLVLFGLLLLT
ncbi:MAG: cytochrome c oxidase subunit 3 [Steroidobacteraceae bacterium]